MPAVQSVTWYTVYHFNRASNHNWQFSEYIGKQLFIISIEHQITTGGGDFGSVW